MPDTERAWCGPTVTMLLAIGAAAAVVARADSAPPLTVTAAIDRALAGSPALAERRADVGAAAARARQAALPPNPDLSVEVENFGRTGGSDDIETTVALAQRVEIFGRRARRREVAGAAERATSARAGVAAREVAARTIRAFDAVLFAEARLALANELLALARADVRGASDRQRRGAGSGVEPPRAAARVARAEVVRVRRRQELEAARAALAALWGGGPDEVGAVAGTLDPPADVPPLAQLRPRVAGSPEAAALDFDVDGRRAAVALERARRVPDVTVRAGTRRFHHEDATAFVAELVVPLPIFDRNVEARAEAAAELDAAEAARRLRRARIEAELATAHAKLTAAVAETRLLERDGIPAARRARQAARAAFAAGALGELDVIEADRDLVDLEGRRLDAAESARAAATTIDRLAGTALTGAWPAGEGADQ